MSLGCIHVDVGAALIFFFFNDTATTEIYTLSLHDALPISPSFAMAANRGPLASRVARLLGITEKGSSLRNAGVAFGVLCLAAALLAGNALFGLVRTASGHSFPAQQSSANRDGVIVITAPRPTPQPHPSPNSSSSSTSTSTQTGAQSRTQDTAPAAKSQSYIDGMKAEGFENLSADDLIGMKVQGITPAYVEEMRKLGFKPDTDQLIGMKVQGITPEYIHQLNQLNIHPDVDDLIGMKVQGINADYVRSIRATGLNPDKEECFFLNDTATTE